MNNTWTEKNKQYLKNNLIIKTTKEICSHLKICKSELYRKVSELGLTTKTDLGFGHFTENEKEIIREHYNALSTKELLGLLPGRSENSIRVWACHNNLKKIATLKKIWKPEELKILQDNLGKKTYAEISLLLLNKTVAQISHKCQKLGLAKELKLWTSKETNLLLNNYKERTCSELELLLKTKNKSQIKEKARSLQLILKKKGISEKEWTKDQLTLLYSLTKIPFRYLEIQKFFPNKSVGCVLKKVKELGISVNNLNWSIKEDALLLEKYKDTLSDEELLSFFSNRSILAIRGRADKLGLIIKKIKRDLCGKKFGSLLYVRPIIEVSRGGYTRWQCLCDCGNIRIVVRNKLGKSTPYPTSCRKCAKKHKYKSLSIMNKAAKRLYVRYQQRDMRKGRFFDLTESFFLAKTKENCYYCGKAPELFINYLGFSYRYNTLDRLDNNKGHTEPNCVSACKECNMLKRNMNFVNFLNKIESIYKQLCGKTNPSDKTTI